MIVDNYHCRHIDAHYMSEKRQAVAYLFATGAKALVITYVINNYNNHNSQNRELILKAMAWEADVLVLLKNYTSENINIYFSTERSIEDELERETKADIKIVAISYVIMFIYLTLTLGKMNEILNLNLPISKISLW